jgi:hypothetical protein
MTPPGVRIGNPPGPICGVWPPPGGDDAGAAGGADAWAGAGGAEA